MASPLPRLASPRAQTLEAVRSVAGDRFDPDIWHVMEERDNALIADEILHGVASSSFVYSIEFSRDQPPVTGISVIGARHLASHYGGLKHRLVASIQKIGELFTFTSYPAEGMPMSVSCGVVRELASEPDFFGAVVELTDIKTGNAIQIERRESRFEHRRDGSTYERPNYSTIAQSKAYRNAVLTIVPQDVQMQFKEQCLKLRKGETITAGVIDQKRQGVIRFAAAKAITIDRRRLEQLTLDQIGGLGDAARNEDMAAFAGAAAALGLTMTASEESEKAEPPAQNPTEPPQRPTRGARGHGRQRNTQQTQKPADEPQNPPGGRLPSFEV